MRVMTGASMRPAKEAAKGSASRINADQRNERTLRLKPATHALKSCVPRQSKAQDLRSTLSSARGLSRSSCTTHLQVDTSPLRHARILLEEE